MERRAALLVAGATGFLGIALGAFGAHALKGLLELHHAREIWNTAVLYHLVHAPVLLLLARLQTFCLASLFRLWPRNPAFLRKSLSPCDYRDHLARSHHPHRGISVDGGLGLDHMEWLVPRSQSC